jgi:serine/threonine-protein kinase ATR
MYGNGMLNKKSIPVSNIAPYLINASWKVTDWECLEKVLSEPHRITLDSMVGNLFLQLHKRDYSSFENLLQEVRGSLINPIAASGMESYERSFPYIVPLAQLNEVETFYNTFLKRGCATVDDFNATSVVWKNRLEMTNTNSRELFLNTRRVLLALIQDESAYPARFLAEQHGNLWLETAKETRKMQHFQTSHGAILQAVSLDTKFAAVQSAKLLWAQNLRHKAMSELQLAVNKFSVSEASSEIGGKARLLLAKWKEVTGGVISSALTKAFTQLTRDFPCWEKAHFALGSFFNRLLEYEKKSSSDLRQ